VAGGRKMETTDNYRIASRSTNDAEIWVKYGDEMMSKGQIGKTLEFYDRALESTSSHTQAQAWHSKANALDAMGRRRTMMRSDATTARSNAIPKMRNAGSIRVLHSKSWVVKMRA